MKKDQLISRYLDDVVNDLISIYKLNDEEARKLVKRIDLVNLLEIFPDEATHYPTEYWAERIYNDATRIV